MAGAPSAQAAEPGSDSPAAPDDAAPHSTAAGTGGSTTPTAVTGAAGTATGDGAEADTQGSPTSAGVPGSDAVSAPGSETAAPAPSTAAPAPTGTGAPATTGSEATTSASVSGHASAPVTAASSVEAAPPPAPAPAAAPAPLQQQLVRALPGLLLRGDGSHTVELELHPAELGAVQLRVELTGRHLSLSITSGDAQVRDLLRDALPDLRRELERGGLSTGSFDVPERREGRAPAPASHRPTGEPVAAPAPVLLGAPRTDPTRALDVRV